MSLDLNHFIQKGRELGPDITIASIKGNITSATAEATKKHYTDILRDYIKYLDETKPVSDPFFTRIRSGGRKRTHKRRKSKRHSMRKKRHTGRRRK